MSGAYELDITIKYCCRRMYQACMNKLFAIDFSSGSCLHFFDKDKFGAEFNYCPYCGSYIYTTFEESEQA